MDKTVEPAVFQVLSGQHDSDVTSVDIFSSWKEDLLLTGSSDQTVRLWRRSGPNPLFSDADSVLLVRHNYSVNQVRFSPQGTMVASASTDGTAIITDSTTGKRLCSFIQPTTHSAIRDCRFSPDSTMLVTAGDDETLCLWDMYSRSLKKSIKYHEGTIFAVDFTPDSSHLLSSDINGVLCLWELQSDSRDPIIVFKDAHDLGVLCCDFAPPCSNEYLSNIFTLATGGNDDVVRVWRVTTGLKKQKIEIKCTLPGHPGSSVMSVRFSPVRDSCLLVSTGGDKVARLWDATKGVCLAVLKHHSRYVTSSVFFRKGNRLVTGSNDRTAVIWNLDEKGVETANDDVREKSFNRQNEEMYQTIMGDKFSEAELEASLSSHHSDVNALIFISNDLIASCSSDKTVRIWMLKRNPDSPGLSIDTIPLNETSKSDRVIYDLHFSEESGILISGDGRLRKLSSTETVKELGILPVYDIFGVIRQCRITPDGKYVFNGGDDDTVYVWEVETKKEICRFKDHDGTIFYIDYISSNGDFILVSGCSQGLLKFWKFCPEKENKIQTLYSIEEAHDLGVSCGSFRPKNGEENERILCTGGNDSSIKIWKLTNEKVYFVRALEGHGSSIMSISFSNGNSRLLMASTSGDKTVRLWDGLSFSVLRVLESHSRYVSCCAFSRDQTDFDGSKFIYLSTGSNDKKISLWKLSGIFIDESVDSYFYLDMIKWSCSDVLSWIKSLKCHKGLPETTDYDVLIRQLDALKVDGKDLLDFTKEEIASKLKESFGSPEDALNFAEKIYRRRYSRKSENAGYSYFDSRACAPPLLDDGRDVPNELICPITQEIMVHPVTFTDGFVYEKSAIEEWIISRKRTSPMTNLPIKDIALTFDRQIHNKIQEFLAQPTCDKSSDDDD